MENPNKRGRALLIAGAAALAAAMLLHLAVGLNLTLYAGDLQYATFFRDGLLGFARNTLAHYRGTNGRWFVHILIPIVLLFDTKLFAVLAPPLTAGIFMLGLKGADPSMKKGPWLLAAGLGLLTLLGSDILYLRMSLYWLAAYFNYAFPLIFPLGVVWGMGRGLEKPLSRWQKVLLWGCAFFAGACTEQSAVVAVVLIFGFWLLKCREQGLRAWCLPPVFTALGALTVVLAPGSRARVDRGIDGGIFSVFNPQVFATRFFEVMDYLSGNLFWNLLFAALCLFAGLLCLLRRDLPRHLLSGLGAAALTVALAACGQEKPLAVFTVLYTLYLAVTFLFVPEYQTTGLMLLAAGASVMLLIVTTLYYARTFFPCLLLFIIVAVSLLFRLLREVPLPVGAVVCAALAVVFVARYVPIYQGYAANNRIVKENLQGIENFLAEDEADRGELALNIDMDPRYRFHTFFEGQFFMTNFKRYYHIPPETKIRFVSQVFQFSDVQAGEEVYDYPALEKDGVVMFPIDFVMRGAGFECVYRWADYTYHITANGKEYTIYRDGRLTEMGPSGEVLVDESCEPVRPYSDSYNMLYMSQEDLQRCFGLEFRYDSSKNLYLLVE